MRIGIVVAWLGVLGAVCGWFLTRRGEAPATVTAGASARARVPVVVELFSSEGCSSCPPADRYVAELDRAQSVAGVSAIVLEEHVDYWDRLGWRDPFGSSAFSDRQQDYARVLADHHVFTPEIVFDGHLVMPGGDEDAARAMMQRSASEPRATVTVEREGARVTVNVTDIPADADDASEVWLAITERGLATDVPAGENAGRRLAHGPIVRRLRQLGRATGATFHAEASLDPDPSWKPGALRAVAFVQRAMSRRIVGAGAL